MLEPLVSVLAVATGALGLVATIITTLLQARTKRNIKITAGSKVFVIHENMTEEDFKKLTELLAPFAVKDNVTSGDDDATPQ
jgi:hypothetical protein